MISNIIIQIYPLPNRDLIENILQFQEDKRNSCMGINTYGAIGLMDECT
jgi:hypothetical protein